MPPPAPTSIPIRTTLSSSSIASAMPLLRASEYLTAATSVCEDMPEGLLESGCWGCASALHRLVDAHACALLHRPQLVLDGRAVRGEAPGCEHQRIAIAPGGDLVVRLVRLGVPLVVALPAVRLSLDQHRSLAAAAA